MVYITDEIRVETSFFKENGQTYVSIRKWYKDRTTGEEKPTKKGISLTVDEWQCYVDMFDEVKEEIEVELEELENERNC